MLGYQNYNQKQDLEQMKHHLICRVVNTKRNKELLSQVPHWDFLDLSMISQFVDLPYSMMGNDMQVSYHYLQLWKMSETELLKITLENTKERYPLKSITMADFFEGTGIEDIYSAGQESDIVDMARKSTYIITNKLKMYGANVFFLTDELRKIADVLDSDLAILPSSIHEVIAIPGIKEETVLNRKIVKEVNTEAVSEEEWLSDQVYWYSKNSGRISIAE